MYAVMEGHVEIVTYFWSVSDCEPDEYTERRAHTHAEKGHGDADLN